MLYVRAVFTHENQDPSRVKFIADGKGGATEFAENFKDDGVFYGLCKFESPVVCILFVECVLAVELR